MFFCYASNEKKPSAKFHFPQKNAELNKQWIRFVNKKDWLATKNLMLRDYILKRNIYGEMKNVHYTSR